MLHEEAKHTLTQTRIHTFKGDHSRGHWASGARMHNTYYVTYTHLQEQPQLWALGNLGSQAVPPAAARGLFGWTPLEPQ